MLKVGDLYSGYATNRGGHSVPVCGEIKGIRDDPSLYGATLVTIQTGYGEIIELVHTKENIMRELKSAFNGTTAEDFHIGNENPIFPWTQFCHDEMPGGSIRYGAYNPQGLEVRNFESQKALHEFIKQLKGTQA